MDPGFENLPTDWFEKMSTGLMKKFSEELEVGCRSVFEDRGRESFTEWFEKVAVNQPELGLKEAITPLSFNAGSGAALATTIVTAWLEQVMRPKLLEKDVIKRLNLTMGQGGANSIKIPTNVEHSVGTLGDTGELSDTATDYGSTTITPVYKYCMARITDELLDIANADIIADQLALMGYGLAKNIDSTIIAALIAACPSDDSNANYDKIAASGDISHDTLTDALGDMNDNYGEPDFMIVTPDNWVDLNQDNDIRNALNYAAAAVPGGKTIMPWQGVKLYDMEVIVSPLQTAKTTILVDSSKCGYFVSGKGITVKDNPNPTGYLAHDIVAYAAYAATVVQPKACFCIIDNTA